MAGDPERTDGEGGMTPPARPALAAVATVVLAAIALAATAKAQGTPPAGGFSLPIACTPDRDCWIMNYPDMDPGPGARDPWCGPRAYDGHEGTDIAVRDHAAMRKGVDVLAAADGVVRGVRDGMDDKPFVEADHAALKGRDCGNGVAIDHGGGWQTQYCHMRRGSVIVKTGDAVARGQRLGLVGLSGRTAFPHVHMTVRHNGVDLDPLTGRPLAGGCDVKRDGSALWRAGDAPPYQPGALYAAGFATGAVTADGIKRDAASPASLTADAPALVLWAALFGVRAGDRVTVAITGPDGAPLVEREHRLDRDQAWRMAYSGLKRPGAAWAAGVYKGTVRFRRDGTDGIDQTRAVSVTIR